MKTNDNILIYMIEQDLKAKGCSAKQLIDVVEHNPQTIGVNANEVVYVHLFHAQSNEEFEVSTKSANSVHVYSSKNVVDGSSNLITRHWGTIKINAPEKLNYFIHYVRIKL